MLTNPGGLNDLTGAIIDAAITVHKETGPGLLEGVYTECLAYELQRAAAEAGRQAAAAPRAFGPIERQ